MVIPQSPNRNSTLPSIRSSGGWFLTNAPSAIRTSAMSFLVAHSTSKELGIRFNRGSPSGSRQQPRRFCCCLVPISVCFIIPVVLVTAIFLGMFWLTAENAARASVEQTSGYLHQMAFQRTKLAGEVLAQKITSIFMLVNGLSSGASVDEDSVRHSLLRSLTLSDETSEMVFWTLNDRENRLYGVFASQNGSFVYGESSPDCDQTGNSCLQTMVLSDGSSLPLGFDPRILDGDPRPHCIQCVHPITHREGLCYGLKSEVTTVWVFLSLVALQEELFGISSALPPTTVLALLDPKTATVLNLNKSSLDSSTVAQLSRWDLSSEGTAVQPVGTGQTALVSLIEPLGLKLVAIIPNQHMFSAWKAEQPNLIAIFVSCSVALSLLTLLLTHFLVTVPLRQLEGVVSLIRSHPESAVFTASRTSYSSSFREIAHITETLASMAEGAGSQQNLNLDCPVLRTDTRVEQRDINEEVQRAMRSKDMFFATMSHEMRTPLTACIGMAEVLLGTPLSERQKECVDAIALSGGALLQLVNDILDFSKLEADKVVLESVAFNIRECVEHSAQVLQIKADEKLLELIVLVHSDVPSQTVGDSSRLRQVLFNLLSNAIKFTAKGHVLISCSMCEDQTRILFEVRDTGIGIPSATLSKLFQPFVQAETSTSRKFGGTGLGLVISKEIVRLMGGHLEAESEGEGHGCCFSFSIPFVFPLHRGQSSRRSLPPAPAQILSASYQLQAVWSVSIPAPITEEPTESIAFLQEVTALVIDEVELRRQATAHLLRSLRLQFLTYHGIEHFEAARATQETFSPIELVIAHFQDFKNMPSPQVVQTLSTIARNVATNRRCVILLTTLKNSLADNLNDEYVCISKPLTRAKLRQAITKFATHRVGSDQPTSSDQQPVPRSPIKDVKPDDSQTDPIPPSPCNPLGKVKVLVVDDIVLNQRVITMKLQQKGFSQIETASNGLEALAAIRSASILFDVIFMDVSMPDMDGYEATQAIKQDERYSSIPIIGVTGNCMPEDFNKCLECGMIAVLAKPINTKELFRLLETVLNCAIPRSDVDTESTRTGSIAATPSNATELSNRPFSLVDVSSFPSFPTRQLLTNPVGGASSQVIAATANAIARPSGSSEQPALMPTNAMRRLPSLKREAPAPVKNPLNV